MPKFLENALRHEAAKKGLTGKHADHYVYGGMNALGAMHGNQETEKGKQMEAKHQVAHLEIHPGSNGGHEVRVHFKPKPHKGSQAFREVPESKKNHFGPGDHEAMLEHVKGQLGIKSEAPEEED